MVVNFRACRISRDIYKLIPIPMLLKKKKKVNEETKKATYLVQQQLALKRGRRDQQISKTNQAFPATRCI